MYGKEQQIALQHFFVCMLILMLKWVFTVKVSPNLINYEWLQQMVCIIVFKNEWYISNEKHMLLSSFSCHVWDGNQLPDPFFPSTCWIISYFNNLKMETMKYCMMENWANINSGVRGSCSFSAQLGESCTCLGKGEIHACKHKYGSALPKGPWLMEVLHNFLPEGSRSFCSATVRGWFVT